MFRKQCRATVGWLGILVILALRSSSVAAEPPTFAEWRAACERLPSNRALGMRRPPRDLLPLPTFAPVDAALDRFFSLSTNGPMASASSWVGTPPRREAFFDCSRGWFSPPSIPFEPFAEKLVLPAGDRAVLMGDLHGDIRSLLTVLSRWGEKKWLDGFTVREPGLHLVFLGDYTDRGQYGVEVIYTLLRLKEANPGRVHLVRGNHEDFSLVSRYGFLAEGESKYGSGFHAARILRAYDFLPVVMYLGTTRDFLQLCHGGMEPGFDPAPLLGAEGTNRFQLLGTLRQGTYLRTHPAWLASDPASVANARGELRDFVPTAPTSPSVVGFMWNDFTVFADEPAFVHNPERAFVYGRTAVAGLLDEINRGGPKLHAVIRAHQHSSAPNPLMRRLMAGRGGFRHWQETNSPAAALATPAELATKLGLSGEHRIPENSVWTLNVVPDSVYGSGCGFTFAAYTVLQTAARFEDWRLTVEAVEVPGL